MSSVYDLLVIGSGPAGQRAAIFASKLGKKVALVEMREVVGGTSINTGTIPSKTMREAVLHLSGYNYKSIYGMNYRVNLRKTMIIVGGGVIGVEYTCMFSALGVRVTLIERRPKLLEFADQEIVEALSYHLRDSRVTMRLNEEVESVEELPDGTVVANLESKKKVQGDALLYAEIGRAHV